MIDLDIDAIIEQTRALHRKVGEAAEAAASGEALDSTMAAHSLLTSAITHLVRARKVWGVSYTHEHQIGDVWRVGEWGRFSVGVEVVTTALDGESVWIKEPNGSRGSCFVDRRAMRPPSYSFVRRAET